MEVDSNEEKDSERPRDRQGWSLSNCLVLLIVLVVVLSFVLELTGNESPELFAKLGLLAIGYLIGDKNRE